MSKTLVKGNRNNDWSKRRLEFFKKENQEPQQKERQGQDVNEDKRNN